MIEHKTITTCDQCGKSIKGEFNRVQLEFIDGSTTDIISRNEYCRKCYGKLNIIKKPQYPYCGFHTE